MMSEHDAEFLSKWNTHTDNQEFNYVSNQRQLAHIWLKHIRKCKCELDETSGDCRHIRLALKKLFGHRIDKMWNEMLKERFETMEKVFKFKVPYSLYQALSTKENP